LANCQVRMPLHWQRTVSERVEPLWVLVAGREQVGAVLGIGGNWARRPRKPS
jgi:hypothetical protein